MLAEYRPACDRSVLYQTFFLAMASYLSNRTCKTDRN